MVKMISRSKEFFILFDVLTLLITIAEGSICGVTICTRLYNSINDKIACDTGRILISNVTEGDRETPNEWVLKNLRRMCNGRTKKCDTYQICQNPQNSNLHVTYTCNYLPESEPSNICTNDIHVLNKDHGFIYSPRYPDIVAMRCTWKIQVSDGYFVVLRLQDLEKATNERQGGLLIETSRDCPSITYTNEIISDLKEEMVFQFCGDVNIDFIPKGVSGLRFWVTYQVLPMTRAFQPEYPVISTCPSGKMIQEEVKRTTVLPPGLPPRVITKISVMNISNSYSFNNGTPIDTIDNKSTETINTAERMIFYVAIALAFLSIQALVIVIVVCIRRQRHLKAHGPIIDHSSIPVTQNPQCRPLPPVNQHVQLTSSPSLMEGYGIVADQVGQRCLADANETYAYAEIDATIPYYSSRDESGKYRQQEAIENVYSELKDCERSGYCEIADTSWHTPSLNNDQSKLIVNNHKNIRTSQVSNGSGRSENASFEGPYSIEHRRSNNIDQSDSEDSLFGNEQYDYIESAHV